MNRQERRRAQAIARTVTRAARRARAHGFGVPAIHSAQREGAISAREAAALLAMNPAKRERPAPLRLPEPPAPPWWLRLWLWVRGLLAGAQVAQ